MERCHHDTCEFPHPFVHQVKLSTAQRIRVFVVASVLFPVRMALASVFFLLLWGLARLRLVGLSREERRQRPLAGGGGWRDRLFPPLVWLLSRGVFFCLGFLWVRVKGRRADLREAPVLAVAPHSGFLDMLVLCPARLATVVSRSENTAIPAIGALLEYNQAVIVSRKDPESRKRAVTQIKERLTSNGYWPQMLMFPEGTTTNGRSLIKFKPGAFLAGVPVQPVLLHYPNKLDSVRWTYKGTTWLETLWYTSSQLYTNITVEFLPVYTPSQEEKDDPSLYADNVQKLMAKALGIPATDYVMEGRIPVCKLGGLSLPVDPPARKALGLLHKAGLGASEVEAVLYRLADWCRSAAQGWKASTQELASILELADGQTAISLCALYSKDDSVDVRQVYSSVAPISGCVSFSSTLHTAFALFDKEGRGSLDAVELSGLMGALLGVPQYETSQLHKEASSNGQLTEQDLLRVLTTHPTYQRVVNEYLQPEEAGSQMSYMANGKTTVNNNGTMHYSNGIPSANKKAD